MNILNLGALGPASQDARNTTGPAVCARKGCRASATWQLLWNNPRIHTPERRKIWLACDDHREWLVDYLKSRDLWKETKPFTADDEPSNEAG